MIKHANTVENCFLTNLNLKVILIFISMKENSSAQNVNRQSTAVHEKKKLFNCSICEPVLKVVQNLCYSTPMKDSKSTSNESTKLQTVSLPKITDVQPSSNLHNIVQTCLDLSKLVNGLMIFLFCFDSEM